MRDPLPGGDSKSIWQSQPTGGPNMSSKLIQQKARDLRAKTRRQLLGTLAGPLASGFFYAFGLSQFPSLRQLLHPLFAVALLWSLAGLYFLNRGMWSAAMPPDAGLHTGLQFCRREVDRRRDLLGRQLLWSFGPIVLAITTFILALVLISSHILPNGIPFLVLVIAWVIGYFIMRLRERRELQREIEELDDLET